MSLYKRLLVAVLSTLSAFIFIKGAPASMKVIEIVRLEESAEGTFGILKINKEVFSFTLELPDRENEASRSSIPAQQYIVKRIQSPKHGDTFRVFGVPGRTYINFHPATFVTELEGCIALGETIKKLKDGRRATVNSGDTFRHFMKEMGDDTEFHLTISEMY